MDDLLIDVSDVVNPHEQQLDWTLHLDAQAVDMQGQMSTFSATGPLSILRNSMVSPLNDFQRRQFRHPRGKSRSGSRVMGSCGRVTRQAIRRLAT